MNIWYLHHYGTPSEIQGMHRPFDFGRYLVKSGHKVTVFAASYLHFFGDNLIKGKDSTLIEEYEGVTGVFIRTCGYKDSKAKRVLNMAQYAWRVMGVARGYAQHHGKPDIIVASSPHPLALLSGLRLAKKLGVPCICEIRDLWPEVFFCCGVTSATSLLGRVLLRGERFIYEHADKLVFLKEGDHTYIPEHKWDVEQGGNIRMDKCAYINNGVDLAEYDQRITDGTYDDADLHTGVFTIIYCGTIRLVNNVGMLLDVAKLLGDKVRILIYGDGGHAPALKQRLIDENITNVVFKGYVDNRYVPYILSHSSLNILNYAGNLYNWSRGNSSNKLFEYFASGKPVLSTVKMGYDLIERYACGCSVEECTAENIAAEIERIRTLPEADYQRMCAGARRAAADFDIPRLAEKYEEVLLQTIHNFQQRKQTL